MEPCVLCIDAGGTFAKYALTDAACRLLTDVFSQPSDPGGTASEIAGCYKSLARNADRIAKEKNLTLAGVSVSTPGPFDYDRGILLMKHKFEQAYGCDMREWFSQVLPDIPITFLHDSTAFMLGEMYDGAARGLDCAAGVTLGTGFGFAICREGKVLVKKDQRPFVTVWNAPYRDGTVEDYVSRRAIRARYAQCKDARPDIDVREICDLARAGDSGARTALEETGSHLGVILRQATLGYPVRKIVLGGQISKSADLLIPSAQKQIGIPLEPSAHLDDASLRGAAVYRQIGRDNAVTVCT